jgi:hypothetical protein
MATELATPKEVGALLDEMAEAERICRRFPTMQSIQRVAAASKRVHEATAALGSGRVFRGPRLNAGYVSRSDQRNAGWQIESGFDMSREGRW